MMLSIIMPSHSARVGGREGIPATMPTIVGQIDAQIRDNPKVEFLALVDNGRMSIGAKMNVLNSIARGAYIAGVGDDDEVTDDYVQSLVDAIREEPGADVVSFNHDYYMDGEFVAVIKESIMLEPSSSWENKLFTRTPSCKCAIRSELCKEFTYPESWHGEDAAFAEWVLPRLTNERYIDRSLYRYLYRGGNKHFRREQERVARG